MDRLYAVLQKQSEMGGIMKFRFDDILMWLVKLGFLIALGYAASDMPENNDIPRDMPINSTIESD